MPIGVVKARRRAHHVWSLRPWQRHSLVLCMGALVYAAQGWVYITQPLTEDRQRGLGIALRVSGGSSVPWGVVWFAVALLALTSTRWPPQSKTWGYVALSALATFWGAVYGLSVAILGAPGVNYSGMFVWALVAFMWWGISGLRNPDDVEPPGPGDER